MSPKSSVCVIMGSISIFPSMYQSTIFGTSVLPRAPPKAVPFQTRPVTSWNGRVEISAPAGATPMMIDSPQPRWLLSSAARMTSTLPVQSKVYSAPPIGSEAVLVRLTRYGTRSPPTSFGFTKCVMPNRSPHSFFFGFTSTPMIMSAPASFSPWITFRPIPPSPNTIALAPASTFAVFSTAPMPVVTPQPM